MKRTYITPKTLVLNIEVAHLCDISSNSASIYTTETSTSGALSRDGGWFDDDDEE